MAFKPPFRPKQVVAVDISTQPVDRVRHRERIAILRAAHPLVPIEMIAPGVMGTRSVIYRSAHLSHLVDEGRRAALAVVGSPVAEEGAYLSNDSRRPDSVSLIT